MTKRKYSVELIKTRDLKRAQKQNEHSVDFVYHNMYQSVDSHLPPDGEIFIVLLFI